MRWITLPLCALAVSGVLFAQALGEIAGEVRDPAGATVPSATVTLTNTATNAVRTATTNDSGIYDFPALQPGPYRVRVEHPGFQAATRQDIELQVQQTARVDFTMQIGNASQEIDVSASAEQLNTDDATVGTVIENRSVVDLPLNGRDYLQLVALSPNVTSGFSAPGQAAARQGGQRASENFAVAGQRGVFNYYTLDGMDNTDVNFNLYLFEPSIDAVQEFKVQTGVYPAEYGREATQINVSTKPGTNAFHGAAFEFLRNDILDAKQYDFIGTAPPKTPFKWNQFGFVLGGPVWIPHVFNGRDKLFFMSNYEGFRLRTQANGVFTVPTAAERGGDFSAVPNVTLYDPASKNIVNGSPVGSVFPGNIIPASRISTVSLKLLQYYPLPNINTGGIIRNNYQDVLPNPQNRDQFTQRIDYTENEKSTWFFRYSWDDENSLSNGIFENGSTVITGAKQWELSNTRVISPTQVNQALFGVNDFHNISGTQLGGKVDVVDQLGIPGLTAPNSLSWGIPNVGFNNGAPYSGFGNATSAPFVTADAAFQWADNYSWTRGKHSLRFGGEVRRDRYNEYGNEFSRGQFLFSGQMTGNPFKSQQNGDAFADLLLGYCATCADAVNLAFTQFRATSQAYYADDTWRVTSKVTVTAGLRYEFVPPWYDKSQSILNTIVPIIPTFANDTNPADQPVMYRPGTGNFYQNYQNVRFDPRINTVRSNLYGGRLVQSDPTNFAPRIGIAYSPTSKWTIRSGFGIFYDQESGNSRFDLARGWGKIQVSGASNVPATTYNNFITSTGSYFLLNQSPNAFGVQPNIKTPYTVQYLFNVQREVGKNSVLEVGYEGTEGHHLEGLQDTNMPVPSGNGSSEASRSPFPYLGIIQNVIGQYDSNYNALDVKYTHSYNAGVTYILGYTWSKSLDDASAIRGTSTDIFPQNSLCLRCDWGPSGFNIPQRVVLSVLYDLPFGAGKRFLNHGGIVNQILGGWQAGSIITDQSGYPINPASGVNSSGTNHYGEIRYSATGISPNQNNQIATTNARWFNPAAFALPVPGNFGNMSRNVLVGPSLFNWDASLHKLFTITERQNIEFRWELFNSWNHPNWGNPNMTWGSTSLTTPGPAFLTITSTQTNMRQMQLALKYNF